MTDRCPATVEGGKVPGTRSAVMFRRRCRAYPLRGYSHCEFHLTSEERDRFREQHGRSARSRP